MEKSNQAEVIKFCLEYLDKLPSEERVSDMRDPYFDFANVALDKLIKYRSDRDEIDSLFRSEVLKLVEELKIRISEIDFDKATPSELLEFFKFKGQIEGLIQTAVLLDWPDRN